MPRILLVEDDPDVHLMVEHVLIEDGYEVDATRTVASASGLLNARTYDLVLADGRLPDGTGMMLADEARTKGVPALIMTAYAFILEELAADRDKYTVLLKPVRPHEILTAVTRALGTA